MFRTFLTVCIGLTVYLVSMALFLNYFRSVSADIRERNDQLSIGVKIKNAPNTTEALIDTQQRILGYRKVEIRRWSPDDPKPEQIQFDADVAKEVECLDNDCRWTKLIQN